MTRLPARATALVGALMLLAACSGTPEPSAADGNGHDVGVQLFQWTWDAIAAECTDTLGPAGYALGAHQPAAGAHRSGEQWWTAYQPVSYRVESRLGTREQYAAMVQTCHDAGVDVWADAVINHMTGQDAPGTGWAGSSYTHYDYPGIWTRRRLPPLRADRRTTTSPATRTRAQVQTCELVNLADLATETEHVRSTIAAYLEDLLSLGVDGFRIDAAKHMPAEDIAAIVAGLPEGTGHRAGGHPRQRRADHARAVPRQRPGLRVRLRQGARRACSRARPGCALDLGTSVDAGCRPTRRWCSSTTTTPSATARRSATPTATQYALANVLMLAGTYGTPVVYTRLRVLRPRRRTAAGRRRPRCSTPPCSAPGPTRPRGRRLGVPAPLAADRGHGRLAQRRRRRGPGRRVVARATPWRSGAATAGSSWSTPATTSCAPTWRRACPTATTATCSSTDDCAASTVRDGTITVTVPPRTAQAWDVSARP